MYTDESPWHGKGIDGVRVNHKKGETGCGGGCACGHLGTEILDILINYRVIDNSAVGLKLTHHFLADAHFILSRKNRR